MNILTRFGLPDGIDAQLAEHPQLHFITKSDYTASMAPTIDVILGWDDTAAAILAGPNRVRFIQTVSAGVDYLPLAQLAAQGTILANTSGIHAVPIAQSTLAATLAFARGLFPIAKTWDNADRRARQFTLTGETAIVYGTGHVGQAIAQALATQGMRVVGVSRRGVAVAPFAAVYTTPQAGGEVAQARVLVNIMPLTAQTTHYFDHDFFSQPMAQPLFINVGRGPSVATDELLAALADGRVSGAALDVFEQEPLPDDSALWQQPNVLITPHISGTVPHLRQAVFEIFWPNLLSLEATGTILKNQVDLAAGY
ncbi:NAD(P)-dependent oxidoreductase [Lacticaseibacillus daqingensis]|uniref:NAD(P)-dependent oxidoreductase n=1 Tax=Lacticaseibacillus daqingensis TaxID=2486014 RepID=UPI000F78EC99|nr:NAD(P)-dependent oxidoreductase [Lacticaseibacillus daqingensis]